MQNLEPAERERLARLLSEQGTERACRCAVAVLDDTSFCEADRGTLPMERARELYRLRAKLNRQRQDNKIEGFDEFLEELVAADCDAVRAITVALPADYFVVFTDPSGATILGVLKGESGHVYQYYSQRGGLGPGAP
jgi:hypothetical protein